jgi:hypothetical protein
MTRAISYVVQNKKSLSLLIQRRLGHSRRVQAESQIGSSLNHNCQILAPESGI